MGEGGRGREEGGREGEKGRHCQQGRWGWRGEYGRVEGGSGRRGLDLLCKLEIQLVIKHILF
jgi:hypothetical protein